VLKGLAADGGLFLPEEVPAVKDWVCIRRIKHVGLTQLLASQDILIAFTTVCLD
jgi:Threonine synthase N terminus